MGEYDQAKGLWIQTFYSSFNRAADVEAATKDADAAVAAYRAQFGEEIK